MTMQRFWHKTRNLTVSLTIGVTSIALPTFNAPSLAQMPAPTSPIDLSKVEIIPPSPVELLIVGAQPTAPLRLRPTKGQAQSVMINFASTSQVSINDQPVPEMEVPAIRATIDSQVNDVAINGDIQHRFAYRQVSISTPNNPTAAALTQSLTDQIKALEGLSGTGVMTDSGIQKSIQLRFPSTMNPTQQTLLDQLSQSMNNLASPLPTSPIGVGSRWRQVSPIQINGNTFTQTATYNLTELKNNIATIDVDLTISTDAKVLPTNQPMIGDLVIKSMTSTGKGKLTWDLSQLMPQQSQLTINVKLLSEPSALKLGGKAPVIATDTQMNLSLTPAP